MSKKPEFDVTVIGAGVVGLSIAHFLSKTKLSVLIIDSENSITLDETTSLTKNLKGSAEFETMYPNGYRLEVSTPGLDNPLKFPFQYKKNINRRLKVAFNDNEMEKEFVGSLLVANDEIVEIASAKKSIKLTYEQITDAKVMVSFK